MQPAFPYPDPSLENSRTTDWLLGIPLYIYAVVFSSLCIIWGLIWDISWHMSIGRDGLFSAPHVVMYVGAVVAGLVSGYQILSLTFSKNQLEKQSYVRFWGVFYGSLGAMYCVWGALAMLASAPFDDWWHNAYGLDVQILTPPHTILLLGMMMVQFGAMIGVLALQNRAASLTNQEHFDDSQTRQHQAFRLKLLFAISAGLLLAVLFTLVSEEIGPWTSHHSSFYITAAIAFPFYLLAVGRASLLRYPITTIAAIYTIVLLIPNWVLPLFPATPKLGPVLNPITHYQAFAFPLLLVIPGFVLDKLMNRFSAVSGSGKMNDWLLSVLAGVVFIALLVPTQWVFGEFLHTSAAARNWFFFSDSWGYNNPPDWQYRYAFHPGLLEKTPEFLKGIGIALLISIVSARIGLFWGNWMRRVQR
ncbi:MAG: hypothetical protein LH606_01760 [Cytophagaceae bacterium]|nr:hypothetical protein [Cytophagaceae bacterium]